MIPRLFLAVALHEGAKCPLSVNQHHYLAHVLRRKDGDTVEVFNGRDGLWQSCLAKGALWLESLIQPQPVAPAPRKLAYSPIKQHDWLIQKAVELGVTHFQPLWCDRTVVRHDKRDRLEKIAMEACEQSKRLDVPLVLPPMPVRPWIMGQRSAEPSEAGDVDAGDVLILDPRATVHITAIQCQPHWVVIGPEGGWSPEEIAVFTQQPGVRSCHVGPRILRAETAALVAATWMDWMMGPQGG